MAEIAHISYMLELIIYRSPNRSRRNVAFDRLYMLRMNCCVYEDLYFSVLKSIYYTCSINIHIIRISYKMDPQNQLISSLMSHLIPPPCLHNLLHLWSLCFSTSANIVFILDQQISVHQRFLQCYSDTTIKHLWCS
jgi:hypothetical protein